MAYSKITKGEREDKLVRLIRFKNEIELDNHPDRKQRSHPESKIEIEKWKRFKSLSIAEQDSIFAKWNAYYEAVKESPIYALFQEQRKAAIKKDWGRVKELALEARAMRENGDLNTVQKPTTIDPWEFQRGWVQAYKDTDRKILELKQDLDVEISQEEKEAWS